MKVGLFYEWPNPELRDWKRLFEESIEQIQLAEELGFDFVLVAEHHFSNYGMSPSPLLQALASRSAPGRSGSALLSSSCPFGSPSALLRKWPSSIT